MSKKMTTEQIEAKRNALAEEQKELTKALRRAKAQERAEAERQARIEEQAKALEFYRLCKTIKTDENRAGSSTVYEWVKHKTGNPNL